METDFAVHLCFCDRFSRSLRHLLLKAPRAKSEKAQLEVAAIARSLSPKDFLPQMVDPREFSTDEVMGHSADRLAEQFAISR